ncbi:MULTISPECIES: nucleotide exchange factor GrpE [unclassified Anabaena]|uniref:nucleotide exchange factor GrpE n=1 Tax=unclassified Anabaena TaxID=2619674 RepID=UPI0039C75009
MRNKDKRKSLSYFHGHWIFYSITTIILIISLVGLAVAILPNIQFKIQHDILFVISAIYLLVSCSFFLWFYLREQDKKFVSDLPKEIEDIKRVGREYYRNTTAIEENSQKVNKLHNDIGQEIRGFLESNNSLEKELIKELMELRQEKGNINRELDNWNQSIIELFKLLERSLENEKNPGIQEFIQKIIREFELIVKKRGFSLINPPVNSNIDEEEHNYKDEELSSEAEDGSILKCIRWGYRSNTKVLERAEVIMAKNPVNSNVLETITHLEDSTTTSL